MGGEGGHHHGPRLRARPLRRAPLRPHGSARAGPDHRDRDDPRPLGEDRRLPRGQANPAEPSGLGPPCSSRSRATTASTRRTSRVRRCRRAGPVHRGTRWRPDDQVRPRQRRRAQRHAPAAHAPQPAVPELRLDLRRALPVRPTDVLRRVLRALEDLERRARTRSSCSGPPTTSGPPRSTSTSRGPAGARRRAPCTMARPATTCSSSRTSPASTCGAGTRGASSGRRLHHLHGRRTSSGATPSHARAIPQLAMTLDLEQRPGCVAGIVCPPQTQSMLTDWVAEYVRNTRRARRPRRGPPARSVGPACSTTRSRSRR